MITWPFNITVSFLITLSGHISLFFVLFFVSAKNNGNEKPETLASVFVQVLIIADNLLIIILRISITWLTRWFLLKQDGRSSVFHRQLLQFVEVSVYSSPLQHLQIMNFIFITYNVPHLWNISIVPICSWLVRHLLFEGWHCWQQSSSQTVHHKVPWRWTGCEVPLPLHVVTFLCSCFSVLDSTNTHMHSRLISTSPNTFLNKKISVALLYLWLWVQDSVVFYIVGFMHLKEIQLPLFSRISE